MRPFHPISTSYRTESRVFFIRRIREVGVTPHLEVDELTRIHPFSKRVSGQLHVHPGDVTHRHHLASGGPEGAFLAAVSIPSQLSCSQVHLNGLPARSLRVDSRDDDRPGKNPEPDSHVFLSSLAVGPVDPQQLRRYYPAAVPRWSAQKRNRLPGARRNLHPSRRAALPLLSDACRPVPGPADRTRPFRSP